MISHVRTRSGLRLGSALLEAGKKLRDELEGLQASQKASQAAKKKGGRKSDVVDEQEQVCA
jgi:hypothetical protein